MVMIMNIFITIVLARIEKGNIVVAIILIITIRIVITTIHTSNTNRFDFNRRPVLVQTYWVRSRLDRSADGRNKSGHARLAPGSLKLWIVSLGCIIGPCNPAAWGSMKGARTLPHLGLRVQDSMVWPGVQRWGVDGRARPLPCHSRSRMVTAFGNRKVQVSRQRNPEVSRRFR